MISGLVASKAGFPHSDTLSETYEKKPSKSKAPHRSSVVFVLFLKYCLGSYAGTMDAEFRSHCGSSFQVLLVPADLIFMSAELVIAASIVAIAWLAVAVKHYRSTADECKLLSTPVVCYPVEPQVQQFGYRRGTASDRGLVLWQSRDRGLGLSYAQ